MAKATRKDQNKPVFTVDEFGVKSDIYKMSRSDGGTPFYKASMPYVEYMSEEGLRKSRSFAKGQLATAVIVLVDAYRAILKLESEEKRSSKKDSEDVPESDDEE